MADETLEQELAQKLRDIAKKIRTEALHESAAGIVGALTSALEAVVADTPIVTVLMGLGDATLMEEWLIHPNVQSAILYEMAGRLQAVSHRLIAMAALRASHEGDDDEDHTGHGCGLDPTVGRPKVPSSAN